MEMLFLLGAVLLLAPLVLSLVAMGRTSSLRQRIETLESILAARSRPFAPSADESVAQPEQQSQPTSSSDDEKIAATWKDSGSGDSKDEEFLEAEDFSETEDPEEEESAAPQTPDIPIAPPGAAVPASGIEERFGARWSVWIGGLALGLGGIFLVRFSIEQGLVTPLVRVLLGGLLALGLAAAGEFARRRDIESSIAGVRGAHIPGILTAAAIVTAFATVYVAYAFYGYLGPATAFVLLGVVSVVSLAGSSLHGPSLAALGLVGSYATPLLVASDKPSAWPLFIYLLFVTAATLVTARLRGWLWLALAGSLAAVAWGFVWMASAWSTGDGLVIALYAVALMVLCLFVVKDNPLRSGSGDDENVPAEDQPAPGLQPDLPLIIMQTAIAGLAFALLRTMQYDTFSITVFMIILSGLLAMAWRWPDLIHLALVSTGFFLFAYFTWHVPALLDYTEMDRVQADLGLLPVAPPVVRSFLLFGAGWAGLYAVTGYFGALRRDGHAFWAAISALTPIFVFAYGYYRATDFEHSVPFGAAGVILAGLATFAGDRIDRVKDHINRNLNVAFYAIAAVSALALAFTILLDRGWLTVALSLIVPGLAWISSRRAIPALRYVCVVIVAIVVGRLIYDPYIMGGYAGSTPIFNWLLFGYGLPAVAFAVAMKILRKDAEDIPAQVVEGAAIVFTVVLISLQIRHWLHDGDLFSLEFGLVELSLNTMAWLGLSLGYQRVHLKTGSVIPRHAAAILGVMAFISVIAGHLVFHNPYLTNESIGDGLIFNDLILGYAAPCILCALVYLSARSNRPAYFVQAAGGATLLLLFAYITLEVKALFHGAYLRTGPTSDIESYTYSAVWLVSGLLLLLCGIVFGKANLRYAALPLLLLTVIKVFVFDTANLTGILRALSFIGLGLVLMAIGHLYQKVIFPKRKPEETPQTEGT